MDADTIAGGSKAKLGRNVRLRVSDTGTAMTAETAEHVFEPFFTTRQPAPYQRTPKGETVLLVEDEEALRKVTKRILTRNGYQVITAASGPEAIAIAVGHTGEIQRHLGLGPAGNRPGD